MKTIILPDELPIDTSLSIDVYTYRSIQELSKQQVLLNGHTFSFLRAGTKEVFFDDSFFAIDTTEFLLMKSGHCLMTEKLSDTQHHYQSILFFFSDEIVSNLLQKFELNINNHKKHTSVCAFKYDAFSKRFVESLLDIKKLPKKVQKNMLGAKFEEIMLYLVALRGTGFLKGLLTEPHNPIQKFKQTIERNQLNKLTLKELAFLCNMSVSTFKRTFKKQYTESPIKWFQDKRLEYAFRLLKEEQKRPSDIYLEVGYENVSSFIQAYKSKYGITPKQHHKN